MQHERWRFFGDVLTVRLQEPFKNDMQLIIYYIIYIYIYIYIYIFICLFIFIFIYSFIYIYIPASFSQGEGPTEP